MTAAFIFGVAVGMALYRFFLIFATSELNPTMCDYCKYLKGRMRKPPHR